MPSGRSKRSTLQKRAFTDAYRCRFRHSSRREIYVLPSQRGDVHLLPDDLSGTAHLLPADRTSLALEHGRNRTHLVVPTKRNLEEIP